MFKSGLHFSVAIRSAHRFVEQLLPVSIRRQLFQLLYGVGVVGIQLEGF